MNKKDKLIACLTMAKNMHLYVFYVLNMNNKKVIEIHESKNIEEELQFCKHAYDNNLKLNIELKVEMINFGCRNKKALLFELENNLL